MSMTRRGMPLSVGWLVAVLLVPAGAGAQQSAEPQPIRIWPGAAPGSDAAHWPRPDYQETWQQSGRVVAGVTDPTIQVYLPEASLNTGAAVVICPGGGYTNIVIEKEGWRVARELQKRGIAGVVLKYRHYNPLAAVQDAHRAVRYVRSRAAEWHLDPNAVGIGGFSAGGHLSLNMAARLKAAPSPIGDAVDALSNRPAFIMAVYPSTQLGDGAVVDSSYPPTFLASAADDPKVKRAGITAFFDRLQDQGVPSELHVYQSGGHGFGTGTPACNCASWLDLFRGWLEVRGLAPRRAPPSSSH